MVRVETVLDTGGGADETIVLVLLENVPTGPTGPTNHASLKITVDMSSMELGVLVLIVASVFFRNLMNIFLKHARTKVTRRSSKIPNVLTQTGTL